LARIAWTTLAVYGALGLLLGVGGSLVANEIVFLFSIPSELEDDAASMFRVVAVIAGVQLASGGLNALLHGTGRFGGSLIASLVAALSYLVLVTVFVEPGDTALRDIALSYGAGQAIALAVRLVLVVPELSGSGPRLVDGQLGRRWLAFTGRMQMVFISTIVNNQSDRLIIALVASPRLVGYFAIGSQVAVALRTIAGAALAPMVQALAAERGAGTRIGQLLPGLHRLWCSTVLYGTVIAVAFMAVGMGAWIGGDTTDATWFAVLLVVAVSVNLLTGPATSYLRAIDATKREADYGLYITVVNIALTVPLAVVLGAYGVVLGTVAAYTIATVWFFRGLGAVDQALDGIWAPTSRAVRHASRALALGLVLAGIALLIGEVPGRAAQLVVVVTSAGAAAWPLVVRPLMRGWRVG
jgi:O-antigen/teichoic acid export membrane protein